MTRREAEVKMGRLGFEPRADRLKAECSTAELATHACSKHNHQNSIISSLMWRLSEKKSFVFFVSPLIKGKNSSRNLSWKGLHLFFVIFYFERLL